VSECQTTFPSIASPFAIMLQGETINNLLPLKESENFVTISSWDAYVHQSNEFRLPHY